MDKVREIDAVGLLCPLPVLKAAKALRSMPPGARLGLTADDPAAVVDVPHFCREGGHRLLATDDAGGGAVRYLIERA